MTRRRHHERIEIEHRGHTIHFKEEDETWSCSDLSIEGNKSLAAVKRRIDEMLKKDRTVGTQALLISRSRWQKVRMRVVTVTVICEPENDYGERGARRPVYAWVRDGKERDKVRIDELYPLSARAECEAWARLDEAADRARQEADAAYEDLPSHDADTLMLAAKEAKAECA